MTKPSTYERNFLSSQESADLFAACEKLPFERKLTHWGQPKRYQGLNYSARYSKRHDDDHVGESFPLEMAPPEIKAYAAKLSAHTGADINYVSIVKYADAHDGMNWHRHREDCGYDARVWIVSVGANRPWQIRKAGSKLPEDRYEFIAEQGSLITMSSEANETHEHQVPSVKGECGVRYGINCKTVGPRIYNCRAGSKRPADAVYVGNRVTRGSDWPQTPFGNPGLEPDQFRAYAKIKMRLDEDFRAQVMALRGRDLLCWCKPGEPRCHARVWLELANHNG
jgi:alkylated DNA repair dioxygenase AlkB